MLTEHMELKPQKLDKVVLPGLNDDYNIYMLRLDTIHPTVNGNKWFKLKYNLIEAREKGYETLLTFGGAYSNHIHATAAAGKIFGFKTIGIIRGEEHLPLNPTLQFASEQGMSLHYVSRSDYRKKHTVEFQDKLKKEFGKIYIVPEGGTNVFAVKGCAEIPALINIDFDCLCIACGTAGTISGIISGLNGRKSIHGFSVLKGGDFLNDNVGNLVGEFSGNVFSNWRINLNYHFGGYAKINSELVKFIDDFQKLNDFTLDPVYTGKMMFGIYDLIKKKEFSNNETIIAVHTGGLQGIEGMRPKIEELLLKEKNLSVENNSAI